MEARPLGAQAVLPDKSCNPRREHLRVGLDPTEFVRIERVDDRAPDAPDPEAHLEDPRRVHEAVAPQDAEDLCASQPVSRLPRNRCCDNLFMHWIGRAGPFW